MLGNRADDLWTVALRRGPYALLALATCLAVVTAGQFPLSDSLAVIGALVATAALLHLVGADLRWDSGYLADGVGGCASHCAGRSRSR